MPKYIDADWLKNAVTYIPWCYYPPIHRLIDEAEAADVEPKQRWIPVTERLPKPVSLQTRRKTKPVSLYSPKGGFYVGWYFGEDYRGHHLFANRTSKDSLQYITTKVTHWMPLPEPPKGSEDEHQEP